MHPDPIGSTSAVISLREYMEAKIEALSSKLSAYDLEVRRALELQAKEYERRMESLNHEAAQLKRMQETYAPRETFDMFMREDQKWKESVLLRMAASDAAGQARGRFLATVVTVIGLLFTAIQIGLRFLLTMPK